MNYYEFLNKTIEDGIISVKETYKGPKNKDKLDGSLAGFEACRNKLPEELFEIYNLTNEYVINSYKNGDTDNYWWFRHYQSQVEWICNVISAILINQGQKPILSHLPTARGVMKAGQVLGIQSI